ncbi:MAG: hypothetical protein BGO11_15655 [Solirubrobacterales bacterium 70-9]|nr:MAG: hypothetical protein BGO11_15655 [Solirubrobacterales bacterium 70-9]
MIAADPAFLGAAGSYVAAAEVHEFAVVDAARRPTLEAWVARLIPGAGEWPGAAEVGAAAYVDAAIATTPAARPTVLLAIDRLDRLAAEAGASDFAAAPPEERDRILVDVSIDPRFEAAFQQVLELTYEAYYRDERVCDAMRARTGFDSRLPHLGSPMEPFDQSRLARVAALPPHYREVEA